MQTPIHLPPLTLIGLFFSRRHVIALMLAMLAPDLVLTERTALAHAEPGSGAPSIHAADLKGKIVNLDDYKGRWVALEWTNPECPFVQKHYNSGNMQSVQKEALENKLVWIQINSTNPKHPDYKSPEAMKAWNAEKRALIAHAINPTDIPKANNYMKQAMSEALFGKAVSTPVSAPYGCSVKY